MLKHLIHYVVSLNHQGGQIEIEANDLEAAVQKVKSDVDLDTLLDNAQETPLVVVDAWPATEDEPFCDQCGRATSPSVYFRGQGLCPICIDAMQ